MTEPLISVIMPAYNAGAYLDESIKSVIEQTYTNWELIIVNDGSTDNTEAIAINNASTDSRIRLINQANQKLSAARNTGIAAAKGQWIAFLDADDLWLPEKLSKQIESINNNPNVGLIFTNGYLFNDNDITNSQPYTTVTGYFSGVEMYRLEYAGNYIPVLSVMVRKKILDTIGMQDTRFIACQDWDYWLRIAASGVAFYGLPDKLFYYRRHSANMSNDLGLISFEKACVFVKNFKKELLAPLDIATLKTFLKITISELVRNGKVTNALFLSRQLTSVSKKSISNLSSFFIDLLKQRSYLLVCLIFKADSLLSRNS